LNGLGLRRFTAILLFRIIAITQKTTQMQFRNIMWAACRPAESWLRLLKEATATPCCSSYPKAQRDTGFAGPV
jgi:hypothetical protein